MTPEERARQLIVSLGIATDSGPRERDVAEIAETIRERQELCAKWHDSQALTHDAFVAGYMSEENRVSDHHATTHMVLAANHREYAAALRSLPTG